MTLEARAKRREQLVRMAKGSFVDRASKLYLSQYRSDLEHLKPGDQVSPMIPVGKDKFVEWIKTVINNFFPEMTGVVDNEKMLKEFAVQTAEAIGKSNTDVQNPMRDYEKATDPIFVRAGKNVYIKKAQYAPTSPAKPKKESIYEAPTEHFRYDPENPGVQLMRVRDKEYKSPVPAGHNPNEPWGKAWNYQGAKDVKFDTGVQNQTNHGWNNLHPVMPFLHPEADADRMHQQKGKEYGYEREKLYGVSTHWDDIPPKERQDQRHAELLNKITKEASTKTAQYNEKFFGETTIMTRQCPDHPGQQLIRVEDNVRECPLDGKVYDFARGFTTEDGEFHPGGSVNNQHAIPPGSVIIKREASTKTASTQTFLMHLRDKLPEGYERRVVTHAVGNSLSLEQALAEIQKADELAEAQKQIAKEQTTASIKSFVRS